MATRRPDPKPTGLARLRRAWTTLKTEQRRVVLAAGVVLVSMLLPWYSKDVSATGAKGLQSQHEHKLAITVPSFVEASIFLVAVAVLVLMFARGERRGFHLPGGDGIVVTVAGAWTAFLVFYRFIDQPAGKATKSISYDYNLSWGIFFGLLAGAFLAYAGNALRAADIREPPITAGPAPTTGPPPAVAEQHPPRPEPRTTREDRPRRAADEAPTTVRPRAQPESWLDDED